MDYHRLYQVILSWTRTVQSFNYSTWPSVGDRQWLITSLISPVTPPSGSPLRALTGYLSSFINVQHLTASIWMYSASTFGSGDVCSGCVVSLEVWRFGPRIIHPPKNLIWTSNSPKKACSSIKASPLHEKMGHFPSVRPTLTQTNGEKNEHMESTWLFSTFNRSCAGQEKKNRVELGFNKPCNKSGL